MKRSLMLVAAGLVLAAPRALAGPGEVTAVSVLPGAGRAHVVIEVRGTVSVTDFTLANPPRLVIDVSGATLRAPSVVYDGENRGGILNIRYGQFRSDVVRIVLELDGLKDYDLEYADEAIRLSLGADRAFTAWSSAAPAVYAEAVKAANPAVAEAAPSFHLATQRGQQPTVTATYDSASVADVMAGFAELTGRTIILGRDVSGYVTAEVKNQPWDRAFQAILDAQGLAGEEDPATGIIRVDSRSVLAARDTLEPLATTIVPVNYQPAGAMARSLSGIVTGRGKVFADSGTNSLIITDVQTRIEKHAEFVRALDVPPAQVSIQAKLIFIDRTDLQQMGFQYDLGTDTQFFNSVVQRGGRSPNQIIVDLGGNQLAAVGNASSSIPGAALELLFSTAIGASSLSAFLQALQQVELSDLQAEPLISTADNTAATIHVGERTPIRVLDVGADAAQARATVQFQETGIILSVTPHVTNNRQILLQIHAENSAIRLEAAEIGFTFQTQEADNQILVDDGQTAVIGGLTVTQIGINKTGIPLLVDLPLIGPLFGFTRREEVRRDLLILVTPRIVDPPSGTRPSED